MDEWAATLICLRISMTIIASWWGGRVGYTSFKYDVLSPGLADPIWGTQSSYGALGNKGSQLWAELVGSVDAKILGPIRMGWSVRYKLRVAHKMGE